MIFSYLTCFVILFGWVGVAGSQVSSSTASRRITSSGAKKEMKIVFADHEVPGYRVVRQSGKLRVVIDKPSKQD